MGKRFTNTGKTVFGAFEIENCSKLTIATEHYLNVLIDFLISNKE